MTKPKSTFSRVVSGTLATALGKGTAVGLNFIIVVILARALAPEDYGAFVLLRTFALFLGQMSGIGLDTCFPVLFSRLESDEEKQHLVNTALIFRTVMVILFGLLAFVFQREIASLLGATLLPPELAIYLPVMIICEAIYVMTQAMLQSFLRFRQMGKNDIILSVTNFVLTILFVVVLQVGVQGLVFARVGAQIMALSQGIRAIPVQKKFEFYGSKLIYALRFGLPMLLNEILTFFYNRFDTVLVGLLLGTSGVAFYEVGKRIPDTMRILYDAFRSVYYPFISRLYNDKDYARAEEFINTILRFVAFGTLSAALVAVLAGHEIIRIVFTEKYMPSVPIFILMMITLSWRLVGNVLGTSIVALGETEKPAITSAISAVVGFGANIVLIPMFNILGAAMASLLNVLVVNPIDYAFVWRRLRGVKAWSYLKPFIIFALFAALSLAVNSQNLLVWGLVFGAYLLTNILFGVIKRSEIDLVRTQAPQFVRERLKHRFAGSNK